MSRNSGVFSRRPSERGETRADENPSRQRSLALGYALRRLPPVEHKYEVLDLGSAAGETLRFYSELPSKIYFADFFSELKAHAPDPEEGIDGFVRTCSRILPFPARTRFDLVNTWDLFNYMTLEEIGALGRYLTRFSSEIAPLVTFIWIHGRIPAQPQRYAVLDEETVEHRPTSMSRSDGPRYKEPDLLRALSGYRVSKSFLLRNGFQEYVLQPLPHSQIGDAADWQLSG